MRHARLWTAVLTISMVLSALPAAALSLDGRGGFQVFDEAAGVIGSGAPEGVEVTSDAPVPDRLMGANDLNDGWVHVVTVENAVVNGAIVEAASPDLDGNVVIHVETWYLGGVGQLPYRLAIGDQMNFPASGLSFSNPRPECLDAATPCADLVVNPENFYSTGAVGLTGTSSEDDFRLTFKVPYADLEDAQSTGSTEIQPFLVWFGTSYVPRGESVLNSGGTAERADHPGADPDACRARTTDAPWDDCPYSGGFFNDLKNRLFFAGFSSKNPYDNDGDASGTLYGANDAVVDVLGGTSSGREAEAGYKGHVDRLAWTAAAEEPRLTQSDVTDAYATIITLGGTSLYRQSTSGEFLTFEVEVMQYRGATGAPVELTEGASAALQIVAAEGGQESGYSCGGVDGEFAACGFIGSDGFALSDDGHTLTIAVPVAQLDARGLLDVPVAVSAWIDVSDHTARTVLVGTSYEAGNGWYSVPKLKFKDERIASTFDWGFTPVILSTAPAIVPLLEIKEPQGETFGASAEVEVVWSSRVNDFTGAKQLYTVSVYAPGEGVVASTDDYTCATHELQSQQITCRAVIATPAADGEYTLQVFLRGVDYWTPPATSPLYNACGAGELSDVTNTCDAVVLPVDAMPPTTKLLPDVSEWLTTDEALSLQCEDERSSCAATHYRLNGGSKITYEGPFKLPADGTYEITYWSVDAQGQTEPENAVTFTKDTRPPVTSIQVADADGENGWFVTQPLVVLGCDDAEAACATTEYRIDGGPWQTYTGPVAMPVGTHTIQYRSTDAAGHVEAPSVARTVKFDDKNPMTSVSEPTEPDGDNGWWTSNVQVDLACEDAEPGSGCRNTYYQLNDGDRATYRSPFGLPADGEWSIAYSSNDRAGREDASEGVLVIKRDTMDPLPGITFDGPLGEDGWFTGAVTATFTCTDPTSGCSPNDGAYRSGDGAWSEYDPAAPPVWDTDGTRTVAYKAVDAAGNSATVEDELKIDATPPSVDVSITPAEPGASGWYTTSVTVALTCLETPSDESSGCAFVEYRLDGGDWTPYAGAFALPGDGTFTIEARATDNAGNTGNTPTVVDVQQDTVTPVTVESISPAVPDGGDGWYATAPTIEFSCEDETSDCDVVEYRLNGGSWTTYDGSFSVATSGAHTLEFRSVDEAGNAESDRSLDLNVDLDAPSITSFCLLNSNECVDSGFVFEGTSIHVELVAEDGESQISTREVWAERNGVMTDVVELPTGAMTATVDVTSILDEPYAEVYRGVDITFHARVVDAVGLETTQALSSFNVDTAPNPTIRLFLANDPSTFVENDAHVTLTYEATWVGGSNTGNAVDGGTVSITDANDASFTLEGETDLSGLVSFTLTEADEERVLEATVTNPVAQILAPAPLTVTWTNLSVTRLVSEDQPRTTEWANVNEVYRAAYGVTASRDGGAVKSARVMLDDGSTTFAALTDDAGIARVPVKKTVLSEVTFDVHATFDPAGGSVIDVAGEPLTLRWAQVVFENLHVSSTTDGWHNVGDAVTFEFDALLDYGSGQVPADGAVVRVIVGDIVQEVTLDAAGHGAATFTFNAVTDATPSLEIVETPEGISVFEAADFGRQRWTEIVLAAVPDDDFVNVDDPVTFDLDAYWAHDEQQDGITGDDAVVAAALDIVSETGVVASCSVTSGSGSCPVSFTDAYAAGLTFTVTGSDVGVTRQEGGVDATANPVWTRVVVSDCAVDDAFVNYGDAVTLTCAAAYEHDASLVVPSGTVSVVTDLPPTGCELIDGSIANGVLTTALRCTDPVDLTGDDAVEFTVTSAHEDVTAFVGDLTLAAKWAKVVFTNLTPTPDGWYHVTNDATFGFTAEYVYGESPDDREPAAGAMVILSAGGESFNLTTDVNGAAMQVLGFDEVTDTTPALALVDSPESVLRFDENDFGRQRWTEVDLVITDVPDDFVNVNDTVTISYAATWAHDEDETGSLDDAVPTATFDVVKTDSTVIATCDLTDGTGTCDLRVNEVYAEDLVLQLTNASNGILRQSGGTNLATNIVWTNVVVSGISVDDDFVNVDDVVVLSATATYAHDGSGVPAATLAFGDAAPEDCTLIEGEVVMGQLTARVTCASVTNASAAGTTPLVIESGADAVTQLAQDVSLQAIWTELVVDFVADVAAGTVLDHNEPVTYQATVTFAHDASPAAVAAVTVKSQTAGDQDEFLCLTDDAGYCAVEISKSAGEFTFELSAFSTVEQNGLLHPDVTRMSAEPPTRQYRWSSIGFLAFECHVAEEIQPCDGAEYPRQTFVNVVVTAIAADAPGETLPVAQVTIAGQSYTTDESGQAAKGITRFTPGCYTVTARGFEAVIEGQTVTWDTPRSETVCFT